MHSLWKDCPPAYWCTSNHHISTIYYRISSEHKRCSAHTTVSHNDSLYRAGCILSLLLNFVKILGLTQIVEDRGFSTGNLHWFVLYAKESQLIWIVWVWWWERGEVLKFLIFLSGVLCRYIYRTWFRSLSPLACGILLSSHPKKCSWQWRHRPVLKTHLNDRLLHWRLGYNFHLMFLNATL